MENRPIGLFGQIRDQLADPSAFTPEVRGVLETVARDEREARNPLRGVLSQAGGDLE